LVDPGNAAARILEILLASGGQLRHVLLTHAHHDHVAAAAAVCRHFGLIPELHTADRRILRHAPLYALRFSGLKIEIPERCRTYEGEPEFEFGERCITTIHTPGHTPGSVCYLIDGFVFTGDTLFYKRHGRTDLPGGNRDLLGQSVARLLDVVSPDSLLLPGHGGTWEASQARDWWRETRGEEMEKSDRGA
jgi:glyoxylase-like metal-dependent hydrolase (beta-lactamase superfamily II)